MSERLDEIVRRERELYAPTARRWPLALVRGEGSRVWDADGKEYIDLTAGWGVTAIGHCHPALVEAIEVQSRTLMQTTNIVFSEPQLELAEQVAGFTPESFRRSFFVSSGAEANEGALKLAAAATGRSGFVSTLGSFHGRTLGAMGVLGQEKHRARWSGIVREAAFVPYGDADAASRAMNDGIAAMIVEPVQGEGGVVTPPEGYLRDLERICRDAGALLIADEIQTGIGRTGRWLAIEHSGIVPDIITLGKGLGGGMPIAAFTATEDVMSTMQPGDHGGTYAGNLVTCRAASAVLKVIDEEGLVERCARLGASVKSRLEAFAARHADRLEGARGVGLLLALVFHDAALAASVHARAREEGVLVSLTAERALRIFPALNVPEDEIDRGLDLLERSCEQS